MTNREYIIAALQDEFDDGGSTEESVIHYNISCPYRVGDTKGHCNNGGLINRESCVACKLEWLDNEVDE